MTEDRESEECKEVYAHAGLALYWAQCLEKSLEIFLCHHDAISGKRVTLAELDALEVQAAKQTLGQLLNDVRKHVRFAGQAEQLLSNALDRRNYLTHRFFKERAEAFMSRTGRSQMIAELEEICQCFRGADSVAMALCKTLQKVLGAPEEAMPRRPPEADKRRTQ